MTKKISALTAASTLDGTELFEAVQTTSKKATGNQIAALALGPALHALTGASTLAGTDELAAYQSAARKATVAQIAAYMNTLVVGNVAIRPLWVLLNADMNSTADQAFTKVGTFTNFVLLINGHFTNASISLTTAAGGIYPAASKGGTAIVASTQVYTAANAANTGGPVTRTAAGNGILSASALYLSLTTAQGAPATADFYLLGIPLT